LNTSPGNRACRGEMESSERDDQKKRGSGERESQNSQKQHKTVIEIEHPNAGRGVL